MDFWFFLKKLISAFSMPLTATVLLLTIAVILLWIEKSRDIGKWLASISIILLYLISFSPFSDMLLEPIENTYPFYQSLESENSGQAISYIVVLGHRSNDNSRLPLSSQLSYVTINRLVEGISIYRQHQDSKLIFSGVNSETDGSHPQRVKKMAIALGVSEADIIVVDGPLDTHEEAVAIKPIVKTKKFILVSSASHMRRAMVLFQGQGLNPIPAPTDFRVKSDDNIEFFRIFPSPVALEKTQRAVYEYLGMLWSIIWGTGREKVRSR